MTTIDRPCAMGFIGPPSPGTRHSGAIVAAATVDRSDRSMTFEWHLAPFIFPSFHVHDAFHGGVISRKYHPLKDNSTSTARTTAVLFAVFTLGSNSSCMVSSD